MVLIPDRDYEKRFVLQALHGSKQCWVTPTWGGQPKDQWWTLPNGTDVTEIIAAGNGLSLPAPTLHVDNTGALRDMLHNSAMVPAVVSDRFVEAIRESNITGLNFVPAPVVPKRGKPFDGYSLAFLTNADDDDVRAFPNRLDTALFDVTADTLHALTAAGVDGFHVRPALEVVEEYRSIPDGP